MENTADRDDPTHADALSGGEDLDDVPELRPPAQMPPITDQLTLWRTWRALLGPLGFAQPQLWVMFLDVDGQPLHAAKIDRVPTRLGEDEAADLIALFRDAVDGGSVAFLYARPGRESRSEEDLSWARELTRASRAAGRRTWPVHLADDRQLSVVGPEDLLAG